MCRKTQTAWLRSFFFLVSINSLVGNFQITCLYGIPIVLTPREDGPGLPLSELDRRRCNAIIHATSNIGDKNFSPRSPRSLFSYSHQARRRSCTLWEHMNVTRDEDPTCKFFSFSFFLFPLNYPIFFISTPSSQTLVFNSHLRVITFLKALDLPRQVASTRRGHVRRGDERRIPL